MTKNEVKMLRNTLLSIAEKHGVERDDFDNLYYKENGVTYRIKLKKTVIKQERYSPTRDNWISVKHYHIKRINLQKWDEFMSGKPFMIGEAA